MPADDDEPELSYSKYNLKLDQTKISQIKISSKIVAIGTSSGDLNLLDFDGNLISCLEKLHDSQVSRVVLQGEWIATGGLDGKINILSCYPPHEKQVWSLKSPILGVDLEPDYGKKTSKQFVVGKEFDVSIFGKGWFTSSQIALDSGTDALKALSWRSNFVVWATKKLLSVYDTGTSTKVGTIESKMESDAECNICWTSDTDFLIGWMDSVKLLGVRTRSSTDVVTGSSTKLIQTIHQFKVDFIIAGLAPFKADGIIILGCPIEGESVKPPEVNIVNWKGEVVANDVLQITGFENFKAADYHLEYLPAEEAQLDACYFIASPNDVIVAKPRTVQDHVAWLLNHDKLQEAFAVVESSPIYGETERKEMLTEIGQSIIMFYIEAKEYQIASEWCQKVLKDDLALWEKWIFVFGEAKQAKILSNAVPVDEVKCLSPLVYEMILNEYLNDKNFDGMHGLILIWPSSVYTIKNVISSLETVLVGIPCDTPEMQKVYLILVDLNRFARNWDRTIYYSLLLGIEEQDLEIEKHQAFSLFHDNAFILIQYAWNVVIQKEFDPIAQIRKCVSSKMLSLMVSSIDYLAPAQAVEALSSNPKFLHIYLNALYLKDQYEGAAFHDLQVDLFAEYDQPQLLSFLKSASAITFTKAYEICETRDLVPEMMYLLGKMGDNRKALFLIIERLGDVEKAIEFAKDQNDSSLWTEFLKYAMDKPPFIVGLLKKAGGYINPLLVIERIPMKLEIDGLKDAIIQIMSDCSVQLSLRQGCESILQSDIWETFSELHRKQRKGICVNPNDSVCSFCQKSITDPQGFLILILDDLIIFFCGHFYHAACINADIQREVKSSEDEEKKMVTLVDQSIEIAYSRTPGILPVITSSTEWVDLSNISCPLCSH